MHIDIQFGKRFVPTAPAQYINDDWNQPEFYKSIEASESRDPMNNVIFLGKDIVETPHSDASIFPKPQSQNGESILSGKGDDEQKPMHKAVYRLFALG